MVFSGNILAEVTPVPISAVLTDYTWTTRFQSLAYIVAALLWLWLIEGADRTDGTSSARWSVSEVRRLSCSDLAQPDGRPGCTVANISVRSIGPPLNFGGFWC